MKTFYLNRKQDVSGNSGVGVVAEGCVFDNGLVAMTWLSSIPTMTMFPNIANVKELHGHDGKTELVIEGKFVSAFERCKITAHIAGMIKKHNIKKKAA